MPLPDVEGFFKELFFGQGSNGKRLPRVQVGLPNGYSPDVRCRGSMRAAALLLLFVLIIPQQSCGSNTRSCLPVSWSSIIAWRQG